MKVWITIPEGITGDDLGNANLASDTLRITYDITPHQKSRCNLLCSANFKETPVPIEINFSESVNDFKTK